MSKEETKLSETIDLLEKALVEYTQGFLTRLDLKVEITEQMAKNLIIRIGTRLLYEPTLGKETIDKILAHPLNKKE